MKPTKEWLRSLQPGDVVGVYRQVKATDEPSLQRSARVDMVTKTLIILDNGARLDRSLGSYRGWQVYNFIAPLEEP